MNSNRRVLEELMFDPDDKDLDLQVEMNNGEEVVIPVHICVLKRRSTFFKQLLSSKDFLEGKTGKAKIVVAGDINVAWAFITYLYTDHLEPMTLEETMALMKTGHLYDLPNLVRMCEDQILVKPLVDLCKIYTNLEKIASQSFLRKSKATMVRCAFFMFDQNYYLRLPEECMKWLLESNDLNILNEGQAMEALWNWGRWQGLLQNKPNTKEAITETIQNLLYHIRWSFVQDDNHEAEWFFLKDEYELTSTITSDRTPSVDPPILHLVNSIDFQCDSLNNQITYYTTNTTQLPGIRLNKDVLLLGIECEYFHTAKILMPNVDQDLRIDGLPWKGNITRTNLLQDSATLYTMHVVLEFVKPFLLKKHVNHVVSLGPLYAFSTSYSNNVQNGTARFFNYELKATELALQSNRQMSEQPVLLFPGKVFVSPLKKIFYYV